MKNFPADLNTFVFDIDGVFTDGTVQLIGESQIRTFNIKDGWAIKHAMELGYDISVISAGKIDDGVQKRLEFLGIEKVYLEVRSKIESFENFLHQHDLNASQILYMGDDIPDIELLKKAGLAACPADAVNEVKAVCHYISPFSGGKGAIRDVIENVVKSHGLWKF